MENYFIDEFCSPLNLRVTCTKEYWDYIVTEKHIEIAGKEDMVRKAIITPLEIRRSKLDEKIFLIYNLDEKYYICVVVKIEEGKGFMITCYLTDKIKQGEVIWGKIS